jgi:hypothetical protein
VEPSVAAIVMLSASVCVRVILPPATNFMSSVPDPAPPVVFLRRMSLELSTKERTVVFCVLVVVSV